jgi:hypothetical protein
MQLLKCKREETAKDWNKEAFCCVLEGVFPFSSSDQSLLLCFLARLICSGGCFSFLQLRSKFASLLSCSIDVLCRVFFLSPAQIKVFFFACLLD